MAANSPASLAGQGWEGTSNHSSAMRLGRGEEWKTFGVGCPQICLLSGDGQNHEYHQNMATMLIAVLFVGTVIN